MFYCVLVRFVGKMTKNSKFWAMSRVLRSSEETPRSGEGPPRCSEAEKEDFSILTFVAAKPLSTAWKCCVFVSFCFSVVPKTCLLD